MKKPSFSLYAILITAVVLIAVVVLVVCLTDRTAAAGDGTPVVFSVAERQVVKVDLAATPAPTALQFELPAGAVEVLAGDADTVLFALSSEDEAKALLADYLTQSMTAGAGERALSARLDGTVYIVPATGREPLTDYNTAIQALLSDPALIPVLVTAERRETSEAAAAVDAHEDAALGRGSSMYTQLGRGARTVTVTRLTYRAGALVDTAEPVTETLSEARSTLVRRGTYHTDELGEPDKKQGEPGPTDGAPTLALPIRAAITSYFGWRNGVMHRGIDIAAKAGTAILSPGEGVVVYVGERGEYGTVIDIDHGNGFVSRLTHCENVAAELNQRVFQGEQVASLAALTDRTGKPHLHYEFLIDGVPYNPLYYLG